MNESTLYSIEFSNNILDSGLSFKILNALNPYFDSLVLTEKCSFHGQIQTAWPTMVDDIQALSLRFKNVLFTVRKLNSSPSTCLYVLNGTFQESLSSDPVDAFLLYKLGA